MATGDNAFAAGTDSVSSGENAIALGNGATTDAIGTNAIAIGTGSQASSENGVAVGNGATASGDNALSFGTGSVVTGDGSGAFGDPNTVDGLGSYVVGNNNTINTGIDNTFVLGNNVTPTQANSVVLGNNSTDRAATAETDVTLNGDDYDFAGPGSVGNGVVSVGDTGTERQLINVAAGEISGTSTDAINGSQLFATNQAVQQPITFEGDNGAGNAVDRTLSTTLNVQGGASGTLTSNNIGVVADGTDTLNVRLAEDVDLGADGSVTTGNSVVDNDGLTVEAGTNTTTYGAAQIALDDGAGATTTIEPGEVQIAGSGNTVTLNGDSGTIGGLTNTTFDAANITSGQAATEDQLKQVNNGLTTAGLDFKGNSNPNGSVHKDLGDTLTIQGGATTAGSYSDANVKTVADNGNVTIQLADNPEFTSVTTGNSTLNNDGVTVTGGPNNDVALTNSGLNNGGNKLTNVADGTNANDAVNFSQLSSQAASARTEVQGGTNVAGIDKTTGANDQDIYTVNADGASVSAGSSDVSVSAATPDANNVTDYSVDLASTTKTDISKGVAAKTAVDDTGLTFNGDSGSSTVRKLGDSVDITGDNNITTTGAGAGVSLALNNNLDLGSGGSVKTGNSILDNDGLTVTGGPNNDVALTNSGLDNGGNKLTNVAAGDVNGTSTDAVNGSQLASVQSTANKGFNVTANGNGPGANIAPGDTLDVAQGQNINVTRNGQSLTVATKSDLTADSLSITGGGPTLNGNGLDNGGNKITNVAAGTIGAGSTDAINGSQLNDTNDIVANSGNTTAGVIGGNASYNDATGELTTSDVGGTGENTVDGAIAAAGAGWELAADGTAGTEIIDPGDTATFAAGDNLEVTRTGATVSYATQDQVTFDQVTTGNSVLNNDGLSVDDGTDTTAYGPNGLDITGGPSVTSGGIDAGTNKITNVTAGTNPTDAVNVSQLTQQNSDLTTKGLNFAGDSGTDVHRDLGNTLNITGGETNQANLTTGNIGVVADGTDGLNVQLAEDVDLGADGSVTTGNSVLDTNGLTVDDGTDTTMYGPNGVDINNGDVTLTKGGLDNGGNKITNVAAGTIGAGSTDAINGSQLNDTNTTLTNLGDTAAGVLGGNATYDDATGTLTTSDIGGTGENTVDGAIAAAGTGWELAADGTAGTETIDPGDTATFAAGDNLEVTRTGATVSYATQDQVTFDQVTTGNSVLNNDGLTVDDNAGNSTTITTAGTTVTDGTDTTDYGANGLTITGGPSVTSGGIDAGNNKITNVADGVNANDAVNFSQLQSQGGDLTSQGLNFAGDSGGNVHRDLGNTLNITGGASGTLTSGNIGVVANGTDTLSVQLAEDVDLGADGSVTTGNSVVDNDGLAVTDGANSTTITTAGTTVTDGTDTTDYGADGLTITGGPSVTSGGIDAGNQKITNVAPGTIGAGSTDAINGGQLQSAGDSLAGDVLGGNAQYDGNAYSMTDIGGTGEDTVDDAIASANTAANAGWNVADTNGNSNNIGPNGTVTFAGDSNVSVTESGADDAGQVTVTLNNDLNVDSVTTGNSTLDTNGLTVADGTDTTDYGADGLTITGGPSVTSGGIDAGNQKITNVAPGAIGTGSTDAINGGQLQSAGDSLAGDVLGGNAQYDGNAYSMTDIGGTGEDTVDDAIASASSAATAGWNVADTNGNSNNIGPNGTVTFAGDSNVSVTESGADDAGRVTVALNNDLNVDSVTTGNSTLDTNGLTVDDGTDTTMYGPNGVDINSGAVTLTKAGLDNGGNKITNVAPGTIGTGSTDAINGSQLYALGDSAVDVLGGNAAYDTGTGTLSMSDVGGTGEDNINDAIASANSAATAGWNVADLNGNSNNIGPGGTVTFVGDSNVAVTESGADDAGRVTVALNNDLNVDSVTTGNSTLNNSGLRVDDGAGNQIQVSTDGTKVTDVNGNTADYRADGMTVADNDGNKTSVGAGEVTVTGTDENGDSHTITINKDGSGRITGVAKGVDDNDAVNVAQLNDTNQDVSDLKDDALQWNDDAKGGQGAYDARHGDSDAAQNITHVAKGDVGQGSTDAINGEQLHDAVDSVADALGGGSTVDEDGNLTKPSYALDEGNFDNVGDALASLDDSLTNIADGQDSFFQGNDSSDKGLPDSSGEDSTAGGAGAVASGKDSTALGSGAQATGDSSTATGAGALAQGENSTAQGANAVAKAPSSTALGSGARATGSNSVALGAGSVAERDNVVSVGSAGEERQITNVAPATEGTDAVNLNQLNGFASDVNQRFRGLNHKIDQVGERANAGVASAMAMANLPQAYDPGLSSGSISAGNFEGESAMALGLSTVSDNGRYVLKASASQNTQGDYGVSAGAAIVW